MTDKAEHIPLPEAFEKLGVRPSLLKGLADMGFQDPSEIQALLIPPALAGNDCLGQARTGTGKTAAFGIPVLQRVRRGVATQALILAPTRELALQIDEELKRIAQYTPVRVTAVYGGQKITSQMKHLKHGPEVLVGTPGRVLDLLERRIIDFADIRFAILDEVDRMLDIGFRDDIKRILSQMKAGRRAADRSFRDSSPAERESGADHSESRSDAAHDSHEQSDTGRLQTIFVSATIDGEIERLARTYMTEPVIKVVAVGADDRPTVDKVSQHYLSVQPWDKYRLLRGLLAQEKPELSIIFCRTKRGAEKVAKRLHTDGYKCLEIHGNLNQSQRDRVMKQFKGGKFDLLVATDLASRGIDVTGVTHVINYDVPDDPEAYVHRIGRTARMGREGKAFMFVTREQGGELTRIENLINILIPQANVEAFQPSPPPSDWSDAPPGGGFGRGRATSAGPKSSAAGPQAGGGVGENGHPIHGGSLPPDAAAKPAVVKRSLGLGAKIPVRRRRR